MELWHTFRVFLCVIHLSSLRVTGDSSEIDDSCEDSDSIEISTMCQHFLQLARCRGLRTPVCATNGRTYSTDFSLARAACPRGRASPLFRRQSIGACVTQTRPPVPPPAQDRCDYHCPPGRPYVCGSDGVVYLSECHLRKRNCRSSEKIYVVKVGRCPVKTTAAAVTTAIISIATTPPPQTTTPLQTTLPVVTTSTTRTTAAATPAPTVASSSIPPQIVTTMLTTPTGTRRLPPEFGGNNTPPSGRGDTPCNDNCPDGAPDGSDEVCGTDGVTYENECHLLVQRCQADRSLMVASRGACPTFQRLCPSASICPQEYLPICTTGNVTYPSLCHFQVAACLADAENWKVLRAGECPQAVQPSCSQCPPDVDEVCGTDNVTYSSECALKRRACEENTPSLMVAYRGMCLADQVCPDMCTDVVDPVCATNGKTYISLCSLSVEACKNPGTSITVAYRGQCAGNVCNVECPDTYEPLCDNKGTTYQNACYLWIAICEDPMLTRKLDQDGCNLAIP